MELKLNRSKSFREKAMECALALAFKKRQMVTRKWRTVFPRIIPGDDYSFMGFKRGRVFKRGDYSFRGNQYKQLPQERVAIIGGNTVFL